MLAREDSYDLLAAARRGDSEALDCLIRRHLPGLRAFVRAHADPGLRQRESSSDLVQSACRQALEHLDEFEWRGEGSFRRWLCTVAMNKIRNRREFHHAGRRDPGRELREGDLRDGHDLSHCYRTLVTPSRAAEAADEIARVERVLDQLPPEQRSVIVWRRFVGLTHEEIAEEIGKTAVNVRQILVRAMAKFGTLWSRDESGRHR